MALSAVAIGRLAWAAGIRDFRPLVDAIAIAIAESGGDAGEVGDEGLQDQKWGPSIGLWQIRSLKAEEGKGGLRDGSKLRDPAFNARAMYSISGGGKNWKPWSVFTPTDPLGFARYMAALGPAQVAAATIRATGGDGGAAPEPEPVPAAPADGLASVISDAAQTPVIVTKWLMEPGTWKRIAYAVVGMALVVSGLRIVAQPVVDGAADVAGKVARAAIAKGK